MAGRLDGKVCVITGAGGGMGREAAILFTEEGAKVCVADVNLEAARGDGRRSAPARRSRSRRTSPRRRDVAAMMAATAERFGGIDVLYNNAGISPDDDASVLDTSVEAWQRVQDVNTTGVFLCCKHGIPHLLERGGGSVINVASSSRSSAPPPRRSPTRPRRARCSRCRASSACSSRARACA